MSLDVLQCTRIKTRSSDCLQGNSRKKWVHNRQGRIIPRMSSIQSSKFTSIFSVEYKIKNHSIVLEQDDLMSKNCFTYHESWLLFFFLQTFKAFCKRFQSCQNILQWFFLVIFDHRELIILMSVNLSQYTQICIAIGITPGPT